MSKINQTGGRAMSELGDKLALIGLADKLAELEKRIRALEQSKEAEL